LCAGSSPRSQVEAVDHDAEDIGWNEPQLSGLDGDDADNRAVDAGQNPPFPTTPANQDGGYYGKNAGQVIKPKHKDSSLEFIIARAFHRDCLASAEGVTEVTNCLVIPVKFRHLGDSGEQHEDPD
jgi:hypothetical protein